MKQEKEETPAEEKKESPAKEKKEQESNEEYSSDVPIPEEFQREVKALVDSCDSKECLSFMRDCIYRKEDEIRMKESKKNKLSTPSNFSKADMP